MTPNIIEALRLMSIYTAGEFRFWQLAGSAKASCRAHIMSALLGRKARQSESGINALRSAIYSQFPELDPADCSAAQEAGFAQWAKAVSHAS